MQIKEIRISNLNLILKEQFLGDRETMARNCGWDGVGYINQLIRGHGSFGDKAARSIEKGTGKPKGWMDTLQNKGEQAIKEPDQLYSFDLPEESKRLLTLFNLLNNENKKLALSLIEGLSSSSSNHAKTQTD